MRPNWRARTRFFSVDKVHRINEKILGQDNPQVEVIEHESHITLKGDRNNNKIERLENLEIEKIMRVIKKDDLVMFDSHQST